MPVHLASAGAEFHKVGLESKPDRPHRGQIRTLSEEVPMLVEALTRAVVSGIMLLDHSSAEEIDRDVAAQGLEHIASDLNAMTAEDRQEFVQVLRQLSEAEPDLAPYLRELPDILGWGLRS
jgi:uncharacterized NAD-dependent epimerase/dehydratase family protein